MNRSICRWSFDVALLAALAAVGTFSGCGKQEEEAQTGAESTPQVYVESRTAVLGSLAPNFTLMRHGTNETLTLADLRGKVVLLNFWGAWCPPCREELPELVSLYDAYKDSGVVILGILQHGSPSDVRKTDILVKRLGIGYPNVTGIPAVFSTYQVQGYPTTFYVDRQGIIRKQLVGGRTRDVFEHELAQILHG